MLITAIEPRRKSLRALYLDGELAVNIDAQTLLSSRFQVGTEITDEELHELLAASDANRAKEKALYLIAHRDHSKKELVDKIRRTASQEAAEKAADRMEEIGLIDDRDYARRYASELFQRKYFARKRVEYELKQKGIDPDFIEELLEELEPEPVGQIGALVERKYLRALDDERGRRRTVAALQRLGYRWEDIRRALKEYEIPEGKEKLREQLGLPPLGFRAWRNRIS